MSPTPRTSTQTIDALRGVDARVVGVAVNTFGVVALSDLESVASDTGAGPLPVVPSSWTRARGARPSSTASSTPFAISVVGDESPRALRYGQLTISTSYEISPSEPLVTVTR